MTPVVWTDDAARDLLHILDYIAERNAKAAAHLRTILMDTADRLPDHPFLYRPGRIPGTREAIVHPNYILVYRVGETIEIVSILHARQHYP